MRIRWAVLILPKRGTDTHLKTDWDKRIKEQANIAVEAQSKIWVEMRKDFIL